MIVVNNDLRLSLSRSDFNNLKYFYYIALLILYILLYVLIKLPADSIFRFFIAVIILLVTPGLITYGGLFFLSYNVYSFLECKRNFYSRNRFLLNVFLFYLYLFLGVGVVSFSLMSKYYFLSPVLFILYFYFISINGGYLIPSYSRYLNSK